MKRTPLIVGICGTILILCTIIVSFRAGQLFKTRPSTVIEEEQARQFALKDAGEKLEDVTFTRTALESENGHQIYRIEFYSENASYQYILDAGTGSISQEEKQSLSDTHSSSVQKEKTVKTTGEDAINYIGVEQAQQIALKDAGFSADQVIFEKSSLDHDNDHTAIYEIEFIAGSAEYEYEIDAQNGSIVDKEIEKD